MTFPRELTLHTTPAGIRMFFQPVREIEKLYARKQNWEALTLKPGENPLANVNGELFDIRAELEMDDSAEIRFNVRGNVVAYTAKKQELSCADRRILLPLMGGDILYDTNQDRVRLRAKVRV